MTEAETEQAAGPPAPAVRKHPIWAEREAAAKARVKSEPVDFGRVPPSHWAIHDRLEGWARWSNNRPVPSTSPGFGLYRSSDARRAYGADTVVPVNAADAQHIAAAVALLPEKHRDALNWYYLNGCRAAGEKARALAVSRQGLADLVHEGRQMLINRSV